MVQQYHWIIFLIAFIVPGGLLALGVYHFIKVTRNIRLQKQAEDVRLIRACGLDEQQFQQSHQI